MQEVSVAHIGQEEFKLVRLVELTDECIEKIADAVIKRLKEENNE